MIKLLQALESAQNINEISRLLKKQLLTYGITTFAFTYHDSPDYRTQQHIRYEHTSPNFQAWHQHYHQQQYSDVDTTVDSFKHGNIPKYWEIDQQIADSKTQRERQMRIDGKKFGAVKGLSIPIQGPGNECAVLLVVQMHQETCLDHYAEIQHELVAIAQYYFHFIRLQLVLDTSIKTNALLNARQQQCLELLSQGLSINEIAKIMQIKSRTVNYHIQNINKALGVKNKYLSVKKALMSGLL